MTKNEKINEIIKNFADGDMNIISFANKIYRLGFEDGKVLHISNISCRCSSISEISKKRVKELIGLKKYAREQFTFGLIESQIKYWSELQ